MSKKTDNTDAMDLDEDVLFEDIAGDENIQTKIKDLKEKLKICQTEKGDYLAGWQRAQADYVNLKKETDKRQLEIISYAKTDLLAELIPLADSFEMAMSNKEAWEKVSENWRKGVEYIYNKLENIFTENYLESIDKTKVPFNPLEHESVDTIETTNEDEDHLVLEIIKKGYRLKDKIIRPAQVKIGSYRHK